MRLNEMNHLLGAEPDGMAAESPGSMAGGAVGGAAGAEPAASWEQLQQRKGVKKQ